MTRSCKFEELPTNIRKHLLQSIKELEERGIDLNRIRLFLVNEVPMRLQEVIDDKFRGLELLEALVVEGKLVLICMENKYGKSSAIVMYKQKQ